ncbi:hypothetical protein [Lusitaniella coriacea]|nr:hypothetical protein [Lusitaniella coriacea]
MANKRNGQGRRRQARRAQSKRDRTRDSQEQNGKQNQLQMQLNDFVKSLSGVLLDITALEVNTMVVERINGDKFIPWQTYRDIYLIELDYLERNEIHESLRDRYLELRKTLEMDYALLLSNPKSDLYSSAMMSSEGNHQVLTDPQMEVSEQTTQLPDPLKSQASPEMARVKQLLGDGQFLRSLRKLGELKTCMDSRNEKLLAMEAEHPGHSSAAIAQAVKTDMIYAQTVIQLDGDVINRYSEEILDHPYRDVILQIHKESVETGERQWRGLLGFAIDIVQSALARGTNISFLSDRVDN